MSEPEEKPASQPKRDPRLGTFLRRAGPIIASERGLTSAARIKLQTIAAEMRLPGELLDLALTELQHETQKGRQFSRWERGFAKFLAEQLKRLDNKILTYERELKALKVAEEKYQLTQPQARDIVAEVAKQLGIRRISASEAERHVEVTIKEKVGQAIWIDVESRERLFALGDEWGLGKEHVAAVIDHYIRMNKDRRAAEQRRSSLLVASIGIVFLGALAAILYYGYQFTLGLDQDSGTPEVTQGNGGGADRTFTPPAWWDDRLSTSVATAMGRLPSFKKYVADLASPEADTRGKAYQQLSSDWLERFDQREDRSRLEAVLRRCLVLEPDTTLSDRALDSILQAARPPQGGLPSGNDFYRRGLGMIEFGCELLDEDELSDAKRAQYRNQLDQLTGTYLAALPGGRETIERYQADYLQRLFDHLLEHSAADPSLAQDRFDQLRKLGGSLIGEDEQRRWATELLVELLRASPESWKQFQGLMQLCVSPSNRDHLPALLDYVEFNTVPELATELARRFRREFNLDVDEDDPVGVAAAMRRELGLSRLSASRQQSAIWSRLATDTKDSLLPRADLKPDDATPQAMLDLFFWGTQAIRLALAPEQVESIQQALNDGPPTLEGNQAAGTTEARPGSLERDVQRLLERLLNLNDASLASATTTIRALGDRVSAGTSLEGYPTEAQALARYLLRDRPLNDQKRILAVLDPLANWNDLLLAIADELDQPGTSLDQATTLVSNLLDLDLILDGSNRGPSLLRQWLLERVLARLSGSRPVEIGQPVWLQLQDQLVTQFHERSRLFDAPENRSASRLPGEAAVELAKAFHAWASARSPTLAEETEFRNFAVELRADQYQVDDDLQRTVIAQQLVLGMLVKWIQVNHPKIYPQAAQVLDGYLKESTQRSEVVNQIFDGEQAWLRTWLLLRQ